MDEAFAELQRHPGLPEVDEDRVYCSVMTHAELRYSFDRLASGGRKSRLEAWLREELPLRLEGASS
jgi:toxin FitB